MIRNSISNLINLYSLNIPYFTGEKSDKFLHFKSFTDQLYKLSKTDKQLLEYDNDFGTYENAYDEIKLTEKKITSNNLLFLALVSFHQKIGSVVECTFPNKEDLKNDSEMNLLMKYSNSKKFDDLLNDIFNKLTNYALIDGIHLVNHSTQVFILHNYYKPLYCISYYVQINNLIEDDFQKNERNCIQKSLCIISTIPIFGNSIIYQNFYTQLIGQMDSYMSQQSLNDKTILNVLYDKILNIYDIQNNKWMINLRKIFCYLKSDIFIILKLILLEKNIVIYSKIPTNVSLFIIGLLSLLPGEISQKLSNYNKQNGMPFRIFHDKYLIFPLFTLYDLDELLAKTNKNINYLIGITNIMISNNKKLLRSCFINLDELKIIYDDSLSNNFTTINKIEEKNSKFISNYISKNMKNEGSTFLNTKFYEEGEWIVDCQNEKYFHEFNYIEKTIRLYFLNMIFDICYLSNQLKNKTDNITLNKNVSLLYDEVLDKYITYLSSKKEYGSPLKKEKKTDIKLLSVEELTSDPLYFLISSILSLNDIKNENIHTCKKYKNLETYLSFSNNLEFISKWIKTRNFKRWYCSHNDIINYLSILNTELHEVKIYDYENNIYNGTILNGKKTGVGKLIYKDLEMSYVGNFNNDLKNGKGNLSSKDGKFLYDGEWKNDKKEGKGTFSSIELGKFIGEFKDDLFDGEGYLIDKDKNIYKGMFKCGKKNGEGELILNNGYNYKGGFKNDKYHGIGKLLDPGKKVIQEGKFQNGEFVKFIQEDGNK